jgi:hypothetical protein
MLRSWLLALCCFAFFLLTERSSAASVLQPSAAEIVAEAIIGKTELEVLRVVDTAAQAANDSNVAGLLPTAVKENRDQAPRDICSTCGASRCFTTGACLFTPHDFRSADFDVGSLPSPLRIFGEGWKISKLLVKLQLAPEPWELVDDWHHAHLLWVHAVEARKYGLNDKIIPGFQVINHVRGQNWMTTKGALATILRAAGKSHLQLPTYVMADPESCREFFTDFHANTLLPPEQRRVWIVKATHESEGVGTTVAPTKEFLFEKFLPCPRRETNVPYDPPYDETHVIQTYLADPLLVDERKMEIRAYWLLQYVETPNPGPGSPRGRWKIHLFQDGQVRLNSQRFVLDNFNDPLVHITNVHMQEAHPEFNSQEFQNDLKRTWPELDGYLFKNKLTNHERWTQTVLLPTVRGYLQELFTAALPHLHPIPGSFSLFGLDLLVRSDLKQIYIGEVQMGPGMADDTPAKRELVRGILIEIMDIVMEPIGRPRKIPKAERKYHEVELEHMAVVH